MFAIKGDERISKIRIAWALTGAGHLLFETYGVLKKIRSSIPAEIYLFFSKAALEVTRMYGLRDGFLALADSPAETHVFFEGEHAHSFPICGKFNLDFFKYLVVCPTTGNTVAKVATGIADSLVPNIVAMAAKGSPEVFLVPTDLEAGTLQTSLPVTVDPGMCEVCARTLGGRVCSIEEVCPQEAITSVGGHYNVDLRRCVGCKNCVRACEGGAFKFGKKITITIREIDAKNSAAVAELAGISVCASPGEVLERILENEHQEKGAGD
ncbi:MAG: flavoprotein [Promethearchaeota archaeon]